MSGFTTCSKAVHGCITCNIDFQNYIVTALGGLTNFSGTSKLMHGFLQARKGCS